MTASAANIMALGPGTLTFNSVDLGYAQNVVLTVEEVIEEVMCDSFAAPIGAKFHGCKVELKAILEEWDYTVIAAAFVDGTRVVGTATTGTKVTFGQDSGGAITGAELTFKPVGNTPTHDVTIYKAFLAGNARQVNLNGKEPARFEVIFRGMIDTSKSDGNFLFCLGNSTAAVA